jgi:hypothetical protein
VNLRWLSTSNAAPPAPRLSPGAKDTPIIADQNLGAAALNHRPVRAAGRAGCHHRFPFSPGASHITSVILDINGGLPFG